MYICLCQGVTDRQIRQAVDSGVQTLAELSAFLGVASQCGRCQVSAETLIAAVQQDTLAYRAQGAA